MMPFPISLAHSPKHSDALPPEADCVVIGGGVIGVSAALFLARAGQRVVLIEKGRIAGEQSSRNWGWVRVQGRDPAEIPIALEAQRHWRALAPELDTDIGLVQGGVAFLANQPKDMARFEAWMPFAKEHGLSTTLLDQAALARLLPQAKSGHWQGALHTPTDMRAEPFLAVPALARLAARAGVTIRENCAVRLLDIEAGRVAGVITEAGRIRTSSVLLAGGAWSSLFLRRHGISIPQLSVRATVLRTAPLPAMGFEGGGVDNHLAFRRRADGGYTLAPEFHHELYVGPDAFRAFRSFLPQLKRDPFGTALRPMAPRGYPDAWGTSRRWAGDETSPFERQRVLNPRAHVGKADDTARAFGAAFPELGEVKIAARWGGMIDTMPDTVPVVDHAAQLPGLTIATGMSGHGFGIGPGFGRIAADLVQGNDPGHDLSRFRLARFSDGSPIDLGSGM